MPWLATVKLSLAHTSGYYRQLIPQKKHWKAGQSREWPWQFFQCAVMAWHPCCAKIGLLERTYLSHLIPRLQDECHNFDCWTSKSFPILGLTDSSVGLWLGIQNSTKLTFDWGTPQFSKNCLCRFSQHCNNLSDCFFLVSWSTNKSASTPTAGVIPLMWYPPTVKGSHIFPTIWG